MKKREIHRKAIQCAFPYTIPIFAGFWFLGITYGILMDASGFSCWYPMFMSLTIFAGSMEFVAVNLLMGHFFSITSFFHGIDDQCEAYILWNLYVREI